MMKKINFKSLKNICEENSGLKGLLKKAGQLSDLTTTIKKYLPAKLRNHVSVANYRDNCLVLAVDNAVWITELRYSSVDLLATLKKEVLPELKSLEWIIVNSKN